MSAPFYPHGEDKWEELKRRYTRQMPGDSQPLIWVLVSRGWQQRSLILVLAVVLSQCVALDVLHRLWALSR